MFQNTLRLLFPFALISVFAASSSAQTGAPSSIETRAETADEKRAGGPDERTVSGALFVSGEVERRMREQGEQIEELRKALMEQTRLLEELRSRLERAESRAGGNIDNRSAARVETADHARGASNAAEGTSVALAPGAGNSASDERTSTGRPAGVSTQVAMPPAQKAADTAAKAFGSIDFSGDVRFRYESFYGQQNSAPSVEVPGALGNPLTPRQRLRIRARLRARGQVSEEFEWGLRLATGSFPDINSSNQSLTDFFSRKNFALDQAYIAYKPKALPGFKVQAGKFSTPWERTELTWDNDISPEGLSQSYTRRFKNSPLRELTFVAWQLPMLERNSAFVLDSNGRLDLEQSRRNGRDLALYGGQVQARFEPNPRVGLTFSIADLYFSGTQFINPAQFFGGDILLPVTVNIPATANEPARTATGQVAVSRNLLVSGNANLGFASSTTNAIGRDGRLASGFNLVDVIGRLDLRHSSQWPVTVLFNYVTNTQARDFVARGADGRDFVQRNDEGQGVWAEFQIGKDISGISPKEVKRGDMLFNYTFIRIEKDAILSPFNYSDLVQDTDVRAHRFTAAFAADPRVVLSLTGIFSQRPNGLRGVFGQTPPGSLNRTQTRLQLDTILRF